MKRLIIKLSLSRKEPEQFIASSLCVHVYVEDGRQLWLSSETAIHFLWISPSLAQSSQNRLNWLASESQDPLNPRPPPPPSWDYKLTPLYLLFLCGFWGSTQILVLARWVLYRQSQLPTPTPQEPEIGRHTDRPPCDIGYCLLRCSPGRWPDAHLLVVGELRSLSLPVVENSCCHVEDSGKGWNEEKG